MPNAAIRVVKCSHAFASGFARKTIASKRALFLLAFYLFGFSSSSASIPLNHRSFEISPITHIDDHHLFLASSWAACRNWTVPTPTLRLIQACHCRQLRLKRFQIPRLYFAIWGRYDHIIFPLCEERNHCIHKFQSLWEVCRSRGSHGYWLWGYLLVPSFLKHVHDLTMNSRRSLMAYHNAASAIAGSLSLLRRPLLCNWSLMPAKILLSDHFCLPLKPNCRWYGLHPIQVGSYQRYHVRP